MAYYEKRLTGDPDAFVAHVEDQILAGSVSADGEAAVDHRLGDARMMMRVYERYSAFSGSRVSLSLSVLAVEGQLSVAAVTSGGSRAIFFKLDTVGEGTFMDQAVAAIESYAG